MIGAEQGSSRTVDEATGPAAPPMPGAMLGHSVLAQRSSGVIRLAMRRRDGATVLERLHQSGPLRLRIVRPEPGRWATAILLNTGGGIAGGDDHQLDIAAQSGTALTLSTQGAERVYRQGDGDAPARIAMRIAIADAAFVEYLPQETILFDRSALERRLRVDLTGSAGYLGVESLIFGRGAMGEVVRLLTLSDGIALYRDGTLLFRDVFRPPHSFATSRRRAMLGDAGAMATILFVAPGAAARLDAVRSMLDGAALDGAAAAVSAWNGLLLVRILAQTGAMMRMIVLLVLEMLRGGRAMPRVWGC
ncbi:urease accessory protein UreD [Acidiphilium sp.]|uniref:urease accessory protein UreD n=1 Tax=Acidiphilium sp. TaxID=527 RepID=UPI003D00CEAF